jgi:hypothetical protein
MAFIAVTVRMEELPETTEVGLAVILTVGGGFGVTVTVVPADIFPPAPVAVAV